MSMSDMERHGGGTLEARYPGHGAPPPKRNILAHIPTAISVAAFAFSSVSFYESAMKQAELTVFVPPVIHYGRDGGGDTELFAIPVTITNNGARTGTVLAMDLEVERLGEVAEKDKELPRKKRYYSAYIGEHPRAPESINRAYAPASIAGRQTYTDTIRFYPAGNPLPRLVAEKGEYRFTLRLDVAEAGGEGFWDRLWAPRVAPVMFTLTMPFVSDQHLGFRRGSIVMHTKDYKTTSGGKSGGP